MDVAGQIVFTIYIGIVIGFILWVVITIIRANNDYKKGQNNKRLPEKQEPVRKPRVSNLEHYLSSDSHVLKIEPKKENSDKAIEPNEHTVSESKKKAPKTEEEIEKLRRKFEAAKRKRIRDMRNTPAKRAETVDRLLKEKKKWKDVSISGRYRIYYLANDEETISLVVTRSTFVYVPSSFSHGGETRDIVYEKEYTNELEPEAGIITENSPVGKLLMQKRIGNRVTIHNKSYKICDIEKH